MSLSLPSQLGSLCHINCSWGTNLPSVLLQVGHLKISQPKWALSGLLKGHCGSYWVICTCFFLTKNGSFKKKPNDLKHENNKTRQRVAEGGHRPPYICPRNRTSNIWAQDYVEKTKELSQSADLHVEKTGSTIQSADFWTMTSLISCKKTLVQTQRGEGVNAEFEPSPNSHFFYFWTIHQKYTPGLQQKIGTRVIIENNCTTQYQPYPTLP